MPFRLLVLLPVFRCPIFGGCNAEACNRRSAGRVTHLRITSEIADQNHLVHATHGSTLPFLTSARSVNVRKAKRKKTKGKRRFIAACPCSDDPDFVWRVAQHRSRENF